LNPNDDRRQNYHQAEQGMGSLACLSSGENAIAFEGPNYDIAASEVMDLVSEMTRTSAEIYELIADLAGSFVEQPQESRSASNPPFRSHLDVLLDIISATQRSRSVSRYWNSKSSAPSLHSLIHSFWIAG
jgi:hypothetical protein